MRLNSMQVILELTDREIWRVAPLAQWGGDQGWLSGLAGVVLGSPTEAMDSTHIWGGWVQLPVISGGSYKVVGGCCQEALGWDY